MIVEAEESLLVDRLCVFKPHQRDVGEAAEARGRRERASRHYTTILAGESIRK